MIRGKGETFLQRQYWMVFDRLHHTRLGEHLTIGPVTIYGFNAMHLAINWRTKRWGYICFHPPIPGWRWYLYVSRDATPQSATYMLGPGCHD